ncbi:MAG: ANTAR domain-containing protein, partial [Frankiaceae bacterium]
MSGARASSGETVVRRSGRGWVVGDEEASDLTSAMVLADLLAADLAPSGSAPSGSACPGSAPPGSAPSGSAASSTKASTTDGGTTQAGSTQAATMPAARRDVRPMNETVEADEAARLAVTVTQLEHALTARVRVEQAIGVLAERHRLRTRDAFDLLRNAARSRGRRVIDIA